MEENRGSGSKAKKDHNASRSSHQRSAVSHQPPRPHGNQRSRESQQLCQHFANHGWCRYKDNCRFSHSTTAHETGERTVAETPEACLYRLKGLLRSLSRFQTVRGLEEYLELALKLLDSNQKEIQLKAAHTLSNMESDSRGSQSVAYNVLRYIIEQIGNPSASITDPLKNIEFEKHILPFMKIIVHDAFTRSCIEQNFHFVIKAVYGTDGERGARFLSRVTEILESQQESEPPDLNHIHEGLLLVCRILNYVVRFNSDAFGHLKLVDLHRKLVGLAAGTSGPLSGTLNRCLKETAAHLIPAAINSDQTLVPKFSAERNSYQQYELLVDLPGNLSKAGPRHDNDFEDIAKITILPTKREMRCDRDPYLPINDIRAPHFLEGPPRLLDINFRLLREDMIGPLRTAVNTVIRKLRQNLPISKQLSQVGYFRELNIASTRFYYDVVVKSAQFDTRSGLIFRLSFRQPKRLKEFSSQKKEEFWKQTKSLDNGSLLALISNAPDFQCFLTVVKKDIGLLKNGDRCEIDVVAEGKVDSTLARFLKLIKTDRPGDSLALVEFPGILLAAYKTILERLQICSRHPFLPFADFLAPKADERQAYNRRNQVVNVAPPIYALSEGFQFDLKPIKHGNASPEPLFLSPYASPDDQELLSRLERDTTLDYGQCEGLVAALTRELALIQGPPGTGKTYLGVEIVKVLLHNRAALSLGPIICICYTNHALDQFLEHLLSVTKNIVRLGSRGESEELQQYNLFEWLKRDEVIKTRYERSEEFKIIKSLQTEVKDGNEFCEVFQEGVNKVGWGRMEPFLRRYYPFHHAQFVESTDKDGFTRVGQKRGNFFAYWKFCDDLRDAKQFEKLYETSTTQTPRSKPRDLVALLSNDADIWDFSKEERQCVLFHWDKMCRNEGIDELIERAKGYNEKLKGLDTLRSEYNRRFLEKFDVIGITTTGLARHAPLLDRLEAKTLICEEAGEVLESHTLVALLRSIEHCILIEGDHMQLRPHVQYHELSAENYSRRLKYNLDISLFERLSVSGVPSTNVNNFQFPFARLTVQRRMRPEIADLIRVPLYPELQDHSAVKHYPDVPGMYHNLFWFHHTRHEDGAAEFDVRGMSHTNEYEIEMTKQLVTHITRQGIYKPKEIAVITPYVGQLRKLMNSFRNTFAVYLSEKDQEEVDAMDDQMEPSGPSSAPVERKPLNHTVRMATVDNFQGEEAKVIVLSLVRSNEEGKVGFLKTSNRINVLLSRAQHGMFVIGDATCASTVKMWKDVINIFEKRGQIGTTLRLRCPRHKDAILIVSNPEDFETVAPEGGCSQLCGQRLECGHVCEFLCHAEVRHRVSPCRKLCERGRSTCGHACPKRCSDPCGPCNVLVPDVALACGHILPELPCCEAQDIEKTKPRCPTIVKRKLSCGHEAEMECWRTEDAFKCQLICNGILDCGHVCASRCYECTRVASKSNNSKLHAPCSKVCGNNYSNCPHRCSRRCHSGDDCGLCQQPCTLRCIHSRCRGVCGQHCVPCAEPCTWSCEHLGNCNMPCGAPCDRLPCNLRCSRSLDCGHRCPSVCGEVCPDRRFCQDCCTPELREREVDFLESARFAQLDLNRDPILVLPCEHFFTRSSLDGTFEIHKAYITDADGQFIASISNHHMESSQIKCPLCRTPISQIQRYNRIIKRSILDGLLKNIITRSHIEYLSLVDEFERFKTDMDNTREKEMSNLQEIRSAMQKTPRKNQNAATISKRCDKFDHVKARIKQYLREIDESKQPHMRVYEMSIAAQSRAKTEADGVPVAFWPSDVPSPEVKHRILGNILEFRFIQFQHADLLQMVNKLASLQGCNNDAIPLYEKVIKECKKMRSKTAKLKVECDQHQYPQLSVEILLLQSDFASLEIRASQASKCSGTEQLRAEGLQLLLDCEKYFQEYPLCKKFETAVERAREMLRFLGPFYEAVSQHERRTIYQAMQGEFGSTVRWYYCRNGHPFTVGECGRPMEQTQCPECGAPVGGQQHNPAPGVTEANDFVRRGM